MEILTHVSSTQFLFPAAAVAVVLLCAALVFVFGFHSAEQPQFDKLPLVLDDRKSANKKRKTKEKKSSPNRNATEDVKTKSDGGKKSPSKEKKEEKVKEPEKPEKPKPKPVEKPAEPKVTKKEPTTAEAKKGKKTKQTAVEKPADFDDGNWEEVPKKSEKKKVRGPEEKKESPSKKNKKISKETDVEAARPVEDTTEVILKVTREGPAVDEEAEKALQAQVQELQRVLKEAELRDKGVLPVEEVEVVEVEEADVEELTDVKDLRINKKKEKKEKEKKQKATEVAIPPPKAEHFEREDSDKQEDLKNAPVFDELGDTWTDTKAVKKNKKKVRKEQ